VGKSADEVGYSSLILTYLQPEKQQLNSDSRLRAAFFVLRIRAISVLF